ncbi:MAG: hypothetical protein EP326_10030 [Deltaproteobacteria bacterium]|nr:MAG: hypothetical protein EP326_10030 [Deltaproteobacteria bacterium]TNF29067.1 MAG: hypothetical protein EP319_07770 [Deltaproteobacteria bacterium]
MNKTKKNLKKIAGQNTAEYLVLLVLIAVGTIGITSYFGKSIEQKMSQVTSAISGNDAGVLSARNAATNAATGAVNDFEASGHGMDMNKNHRYSGGN